MHIDATKQRKSSRYAQISFWLGLSLVALLGGTLALEHFLLVDIMQILFIGIFVTPPICLVLAIKSVKMYNSRFGQVALGLSVFYTVAWILFLAFWVWALTAEPSLS